MQHKRAVVNALLKQRQATPPADPEAAWDLLSAAHIVGQTDIRLHVRVHWAMLLFAIKNRDVGEVLGQLFRLGLIPLGHIFQRLPLGNVGRANVSAFMPMTVPPRLTQLIRNCMPMPKDPLEKPLHPMTPTTTQATRWRWLGLALLFWALDQAIKYGVTQSMQLFDSRPIFTGFNWVYVLNPGAAFSFLADAGGWQRHFFTTIAFTVSAVLAVVLWRGVAQKAEALAYALLLAGALGNGTDRIRIGAVVDYLDLYWRNWHWPAFNLADICVCVAALLLIRASWQPGATTSAKECKNHAA